MFSLFKSAPFVDEVLGIFNRHGRHWIGTINISLHGILELRLFGDRKAPDSIALALARDLSSRYPAYKNEIETEIYEHFLSYVEAHSMGELVELTEPFPQILNAEQVWSHVCATHVLIELMEGIATVEIAYRVEWDEEHTVGARLQGWRFLELCGSI